MDKNINLIVFLPKVYGFKSKVGQI